MTGKTRTIIENREQLVSLFEQLEIKTEHRNADNFFGEVFEDKGAMALANTVYRLKTQPQTLGPKWVESQVVYFTGLLTEYIESYFEDAT